MANVIKCPSCGENNPAEHEFCQYCQARLQPLTGNLRGADAPLTPGQLPTKKNTGELEPILPQWLRDARSSARQTTEDNPTKAIQPPQAPPRPASSVGNDLLAGLHAQRQADGDDDDTPDWLADITGEAPKAKKSQPESADVRWVELGDANDFAQSETDADDTPAWLKGISPTTPQPEQKDDLGDWFRDASDSQKPQQPSQPISFDNSFSAPPAAETQDWLHSMAADGGEFNDSANTVDEPFIASDTPDWLRAMDAKNDVPPVASSIPPVSSDTPDWLRAMASENDAPSKASSTPPVSSDTPDWLRAMASENDAPLSASSTPPVSSETPDWLRAMDAKNDAPPVASSVLPVSSDTPDWLHTENDTTPASSDTPDWLRSMAVENDAPSRVPPVSSNTPDWLRAMDAPEKTQSADSAIFSGTGSGEPDAALPSDGDAPDWLKGFDSDASSSPDLDWLKGLPTGESEQPAQDSAPTWLSDAPAFTPAQEQPVPAIPEKEDAEDVPSWLKSAPAQEQTPAAPEKDDNPDIPSWLKASAPQSSIFDEPAGQEATVPASSSDTPDWLSAFKSVDVPAAPPQTAPAFSMDAPADSVPPVFTDKAQPGAKEESLFTDMPDWLSMTDDSVTPESVPAPITNTDVIAPGDLPSWVQAMRPVDAGIPQPTSTTLSGDKKLESRGALAGLQGVLPSVPGFFPTSKPKAYSIRMQASEEQKAHAALLEQILAAETAPVPLDSFSMPGTSRGLRWLLVFLFFVSLTAVFFVPTPIFSMPVGRPFEVDSALQVVQNIPEGAPVLVVFDYEPARVGEMEVAAAPVFDQMILLRHPHLTFISANETGMILAERFISGPLAGHNYQSGVTYLNLGYLPGGQMGIRAFAENPSATAPYAYAQSSNLFNFAPTPAWSLPPLQDVKSLSQFAALILITDNADSSRAWIEQTTSARGAIPFVVISSAQAAPMIQPYYASQQINGLVSGLYGGALVEQSNAGRPGTARIYWDAYSIGMLLAMALILGGGLLNLALGLRDRAAAREAK